MFRTCLLLLLCTAGALSAQDDYTLEAASTELRSGDRVRAAEILDSLEGNGLVSPEFYLALGNARFETGQFGSAILAYERGLRLRPGNADLRNNLEYVRQEAGITAPELPEFFLIRTWHLAGAWLGTDLCYLLGIACWWLAVAGAGWWYLRRHRMAEKQRFALLPLAALFAVLCGVFFLLGESRYDLLHATDQAILTTDAVLRVAPTEEGSVEAELTEGYKLQITDRVNRFVKVQLPDGRQGYVNRAEIEVI